MRTFLGLAWVALLLMQSVSSPAEEYFLDGMQRRELLMQGHITGRDGALYDVWIVPGYQVPGRRVRQGWAKAGKDLEDYGEAAYYDKAADTTRAVMRFARREALRDFALEGTARAWQRVTAQAAERTRRRVFGWWAAWPWAVIEGSAESAFRVGAGVPGSAVLWAGGAVATPAGFLAWPATAASWHALGEGTLLPAAAAGWNTIAAPPLALAGQQPAPERADGFWMKRLADPADADIRARLAAWQQQWRAAAPVAGAQAALAAREAQYVEKTQVLREAIRREAAAWETDRHVLAAAVSRAVRGAALPTIAALRRELLAAGYGADRLAAQRDVLVAELSTHGLGRDEAQYLVSALLDAPPPAPGEPTRDAGRKTDPLREVIEGAGDAMSPYAPSPTPASAP